MKYDWGTKWKVTIKTQCSNEFRGICNVKNKMTKPVFAYVLGVKQRDKI